MIFLYSYSGHWIFRPSILLDRKGFGFLGIFMLCSPVVEKRYYSILLVVVLTAWKMVSNEVLRFFILMYELPKRARGIESAREQQVIAAQLLRVWCIVDIVQAKGLHWTIHIEMVYLCLALALLYVLYIFASGDRSEKQIYSENSLKATAVQTHGTVLQNPSLNYFELFTSCTPLWIRATSYDHTTSNQSFIW